MADDPLSFGVDLSSVRDRVTALKYFMSVTGILSAVQAIEGDIAVNPPAAFVSIASEDAEQGRLIEGHGTPKHRQRVTTSISILFCIPSDRADREEDKEVEQVRKAVIRQMVGWIPEGAEKALYYQRFQARGAGDGLYWGECLFGTSWTMLVG